jgi:hypothetical protein
VFKKPGLNWHCSFSKGNGSKAVLRGEELRGDLASQDILKRDRSGVLEVVRRLFLSSPALFMAAVPTTGRTSPVTSSLWQKRGAALGQIGDLLANAIPTVPGASVVAGASRTGSAPGCRSRGR